jgi:hypothetical protein
MFRKLTIALASGVILASASVAYAKEGYVGDRSDGLARHQVQPFTAAEKAWFDHATGSVDGN